MGVRVMRFDKYVDNTGLERDICKQMKVKRAMNPRVKKATRSNVEAPCRPKMKNHLI